MAQRIALPEEVCLEHAYSPLEDDDHYIVERLPNLPCPGCSPVGSVFRQVITTTHVRSRVNVVRETPAGWLDRHMPGARWDPANDTYIREFKCVRMAFPMPTEGQFIRHSESIAVWDTTLAIGEESYWVQVDSRGQSIHVDPAGAHTGAHRLSWAGLSPEQIAEAISDEAHTRALRKFQSGAQRGREWLRDEEAKKATPPNLMTQWANKVIEEDTRSAVGIVHRALVDTFLKRDPGDPEPTPTAPTRDAKGRFATS